MKSKWKGTQTYEALEVPVQTSTCKFGNSGYKAGKEWIQEMIEYLKSQPNAYGKAAVKICFDRHIV